MPRAKCPECGEVHAVSKSGKPWCHDNPDTRLLCIGCDMPVEPSAVKPYRKLCVSIYDPDIARWDAFVRELKRRGYTKANRSALLRYAMRQLDLDDIPPPPTSGDLDDVRGIGRAGCPKCDHAFEYAVTKPPERKCPECGEAF